MEQVGLAATSEVTLWALFLEAGFVVKLVMLGLVGASIWTWAIVADKWISFAKFRRQLDQFEQVFWSGQSLEGIVPDLVGPEILGHERDLRFRHARVEEILRARRKIADRPADAHRQGDGCNAGARGGCA